MKTFYRNLSLGCAITLMTACGGQSVSTSNTTSPGNSNTSGSQSNLSTVNSSTASESPRALSTFKDERITWDIYQMEYDASRDLEGEPRVENVQLRTSGRSGPVTKTFTPRSNIWVTADVGPTSREMTLICRVTAVESERIKPGDQVEVTLDGVYDGYRAQAYFALSPAHQTEMPKGEYLFEFLLAPKKGVEPQLVYKSNFTVQ